MQAMPSILSDLLGAMITRLEGDGQVGAKAGDRIYRLQAPPGVARPYVVAGTLSEQPFDGFMRAGATIGVAWHIWSDAVRGDEGLVLYGHLKRLFDLVPLTVGAVTVTGRMTLVAQLADPDGRTSHTVAQYDVLAQAAA